jgi:hypothetical protein
MTHLFIRVKNVSSVATWRILLSVILLSVVMLGGMQSVIKLNVVMLSDILKSFIVQSLGAVMLSISMLFGQVSLAK